MQRPPSPGLVVFASRPNSSQISFCRPLHHGLAVCLDHHHPKRSVNPIEGKRLNGLYDLLDSGRRQRDVVRIAVHETDVLSVWHHLDDVAGEQRTFAAGAFLPMEHCAAIEVTATTDKR